MMNFPLAFGMPGTGEWLLIAIAALLIFGKRLPEVGKSLGQGIVEFKKGLKGIEGEITTSVNNAGVNSSGNASAYPQQQQLPPQQASSYKFDPYTGKPIEQPIANSPTNPSQP